MIRNQDGFTVIEVISVILILGIVSALALIRFSPESIDINTAAQIVRSDLRFVQRLAMGQNTTAMSITFTNGAAGYFTFDPAANSVRRGLPSGITISSATKTLGYNEFGEPDFAGVSDFVQVTNGTQTMTITVEQFTGLVTLTGP